ncbi:MucR family transcriptional regulator [Photobacterium sp. TLY01]|uniref:MucR family transcriptional regulator n=1 Tax=Photobacterium sp. TLY01 TaxID=2907534 RepID=UPI001F350FF1|nr:MucR family transcriptional regulator [Photobacterium sp. TLY01]UIP28910.1 MucR family transcriptional regulator [Photobacterium sp. TLY01]
MFTSAEEVAEYLSHEHIKCLECGRTFAFLPHHIRRTHHMTSEEYREKYNLPVSAPLAGQTYRAQQREKLLRMRTEGRIDTKHLASASDIARTAGRGQRRDFDLAAQAERASQIPHEQLPPGAKRADGRDADRAREYQRKYRNRKID